MPPVLSARQTSLGALLAGNNRFRVPAYQRVFAWENKDALKMLATIENAIADLDRGVQHHCYLGTIICHRSAEAGSVYEIIDGQQRLTVFTMIAAVIRDFPPGTVSPRLAARFSAVAELDGEPRLVMREAADQDFFAKIVQQPGSTGRYNRIKTPKSSHAAIRQCRNALRNELAERSPQQLERIGEFMLDNCIVLLMTTDEDDFAYQIFLSHNEHGKDLTPGDILRGELIGPLDEAQRAEFDTLLAQLDRYDQAEREAKTLPSRGKTFFTHLQMLVGTDGSQIISDFRRVVLACGGPRRFVTDHFIPAARIYQLIKAPQEHAESLTPGLVEQLQRLAWYELMNDDDWITVAILGFQKFGADKPALERFLHLLECYALALALLSTGYLNRQRRYRAVRKRMADPAATVESVWDLTPSERLAVLGGIAHSLYTIDRKLCRMVLFRLDAALSQRPLSFYDEMIRRVEHYSTEHILPDGERVPPYWSRLFPKKREFYAQCIGNLCIVTKKLNGVLGQLEYPAKVAKLKGQGSGPFMLTNEIARLPHWNQNVIADRTQRLVDVARQLWKLTDVELPPLDERAGLYRDLRRRLRS